MTSEVGFTPEDIAGFEQSIFAKSGQTPQPKVEVNIPEEEAIAKPIKGDASKPKKESKNDLIQKIMILSNELDIDQHERPLKNMKKQQLRERLGQLVNIAAGKLSEDAIEKPSVTINGEVFKHTRPDTDEANVGGVSCGSPEDRLFEQIENNKYGAASDILFNLNMCVSYLIETSTHMYKKELGVYIDGLSSDLNEPCNKSELKKILADICKENMPDIDQYLTATNRYILFMLSMSVKNVKKDGVEYGQYDSHETSQARARAFDSYDEEEINL